MLISEPPIFVHVLLFAQKTGALKHLLNGLRRSVEWSGFCLVGKWGQLRLSRITARAFVPSPHASWCARPFHDGIGSNRSHLLVQKGHVYHGRFLF